VLRAAAELTTSQAAAVLGVSRPTVVRLIDAGKLRARRVGSHRRLALSDVIAYREASSERRHAALDRMLRQAEDAHFYE
jgi:excisionase family DNA binding protein